MSRLLSLPRADRYPLTILACLPLALLWPFLLGIKVLYYRDLTLVFEPQWNFVKASLWTGQLPLWNPLLGGGFPQWASMEPAFLYPLHSLFFYVDFSAALHLTICLHLILAGCGSYALGRELGWPRPAALLAALSFSASGYLVSLTNLYSSLEFAALLPLVQLTFQRLCRRPNARQWLIAWLMLALSLSTGRPDLVVIMLLFLTAYAICQGSRLDSHWYLPFLRLAVLTVLALAINAVTILPAWELIRHSNRQAGISVVDASMFPVTPGALLQFIFPQFFGNVGWGTDWGRYFTGEPEQLFTQLYLTVYPGMGVYLLAGYGMIYNRRSLVNLLSGVALFSLLMALGNWCGLFLWVHQLPLFSLIRYPAKYLLLWEWALVLLAGSGMAAWLRQPARGRTYFTSCLALSLTVLLMLLILYATQGLWRPVVLDHDWSALTSGPVQIDLRQHLALTLPPALAGIMMACALPCLLLAVMCWVALEIARGRHGHTWVCCLLLVAALDLIIQARPFMFGAGSDYYKKVPQLATFLQQRASPTELFRLHVLPVDGVPGEGDRARLDRFLGWEPQSNVSRGELVYRWTRAQLAALIPLSFGVSGTQESPSNLMPAHSVPYLLAALPERGALLAVIGGLMNIRYFQQTRVTDPAQAPAPPSYAANNPMLQPIYSDSSSGVSVYENRSWRPRAYFVPQAVVVPTLTAAVRLLATPGQPWERQVVLLQDDALELTLQLRRSLPGRQPALPRRCQVTEYRNQFVQIAVETPESGYLVLADNYYPAWEAEVDGQRRPILQANAVVRAVWVDAGRHQVVFRYMPHSWYAGLAISLAVLVSFLFAGWRVIRPQ